MNVHDNPLGQTGANLSSGSKGHHLYHCGDPLMCLRHLIEGNYNLQLDGDDETSAAVRQLIGHFGDKSLLQLERTVESAMQASDAMTSVSFVTGDMREIDSHAQGISAASEEMSATINQIAPGQQRGGRSCRKDPGGTPSAESGPPIRRSAR